MSAPLHDGVGSRGASRSAGGTCTVAARVQCPPRPTTAFKERGSCSDSEATRRRDRQAPPGGGRAYVTEAMSAPPRPAPPHCAGHGGVCPAVRLDPVNGSFIINLMKLRNEGTLIFLVPASNYFMF